MTLQELVAAVFGPWGAGILAFLLMLWLARDHVRRDAKTEDQLERAENIADVAVAGWREQTTASAKSAEGNEASAIAITAIKDQLVQEAAERRTAVARGRRT